MARTPFLLEKVDFGLPKLPNSTATSGEVKICGNVCTHMSNSTKVDASDVAGYIKYFDTNYPSKMTDDQKVLNGIWMVGRVMAPFDLGADRFVHAALIKNAMDFIHNNKTFYVTWGQFTEVSRYWSHVLSQLGVIKGSATVNKKVTITTGTSSVDTDTRSVVDAWKRETHQSLSANIGLDVPFINAGVAGEMSQAETNSGSTTNTTSSQIGMTTSNAIEQMFTFKGPQPGEPDPIDLTYWQLCQSTRLGSACWLSPKPIDPKTHTIPSGSVEIEWPRMPLGSGGWAALVQKFDTFQISRDAHN